MPIIAGLNCEVFPPSSDPGTCVYAYPSASVISASLRPFTALRPVPEPDPAGPAGPIGPVAPVSLKGIPQSVTVVSVPAGSKTAFVSHTGSPSPCGTVVDQPVALAPLSVPVDAVQVRILGRITVLVLRR